jgi:hypothetical protein
MNSFSVNALISTILLKSASSLIMIDPSKYAAAAMKATSSYTSSKILSLTPAGWKPS